MLERSIRITRARQTEETVPPIVLNNCARTPEETGRLDPAVENAACAYGQTWGLGH
jgi:hypothetical protein